jgi:hypothetical protein
MYKRKLKNGEVVKWNIMEMKKMQFENASAKTKVQ